MGITIQPRTPFTHHGGNGQPSPTPGCAATLILSCLCLCFACNSSLSTAYCNLSFFALICFNLNISLEFAPSPASPAAFTLDSDEDRPLRPSSPPEDSRPSSNSQRAMRACSRRSSRSRCDSQRERRELISGVRESRRER